MTDNPGATVESSNSTDNGPTPYELLLSALGA
jgi:uncharacterized OsmC-like protein